MIKKVSRILILIGAIYGIVSIVSLLIAGIVTAVLASPTCTEFLTKGLTEGWAHTSFEGSQEEQVAFMQLVLLIISILVFVLVIPAVVSSILCFLGLKKENKSLLIAILVFSILCGNEVAGVGAIFGLIALSRNPGNPNVIDSEESFQ